MFFYLVCGVIVGWVCDSVDIVVVLGVLLGVVCGGIFLVVGMVCIML